MLGVVGEEHLISSTEFLELDELPERIVLVGGGYIAAEFSHIAARAGAKVTVLQRGERMLRPFDADIVAWLTEKSRDIGIDLGTTHTVVAYADLRDGAGQAQPTLFEIEQLIAPGEVAKRPLLPSFRYHPADGELPADQQILPWRPEPLPGDNISHVVGELAPTCG